jgi:hypothetical protein
MNTNSDTNSKPARVQLGTVDKLNTILNAWENLAPEAKFAEMTFADFRLATSGVTETRRKLVTNRAGICSMVSAQKVQTEALRGALKRVGAAVVVDGNFGADSPLYRAMGYVRPSERKSPSAPVADNPPTPQGGAAASTPAPAPAPGTSAAKTRSKPLLERYQEMLAAWADAEMETIGGIKLENWKPAGESLVATKRGLLEARTERRALVGVKKSADSAALSLIKKVVASVVASPAYGENSALYRGMGYVPKNERKTPSRSSGAAVTA